MRRVLFVDPRQRTFAQPKRRVTQREPMFDLRPHRRLAFGSAGTRVRRAAGRFLLSARAGATAVVSAAVSVMALAAAALIVDHVWLIDQRDVLNNAAAAAAVAATNEMNRRLVLDPDMSQDDLVAAVSPVAKSWIELNLSHLPAGRLARARETLRVTVTPDRDRGTVDVTAAADLGGTLLSRKLPLLNSYAGPEKIGTRAGVETRVTPIEVVLAIDMSSSMAADLEGGFVDENSGEKSRMDIVKDAAKALVNVLRPNRHNRVAIGVVPWHMNVRLGDTMATAWSDNGWALYPTERTYDMPYECTRSLSSCTPAAVTATLPSSAPEEWDGCLDGHRMGGSGTSAAAPEDSDLFALPSVSAFSQAYFPAYYGIQYECDGGWLEISDIPSDYYSLKCYHPYDPYDAGYADLRPQYGCEDTGPPVLPLSTNRAAIVDAIDGLSPVGDRTFSALGVLWAQRMLLSTWRSVWGGTVHPVDPASAAGKGVRKIIVLLTDGDDSICNVHGRQCNDDTIGISRSDACTQATDAGIEIFVVTAMHPDKISTDFGTSLTSCSSQSDDSDVNYAFLNNPTAADLQAAFESIASQLRTVRRTH